MKIVLDTNVIQEDFLMRSGRFEVLFDFVKKTESQFVLTRLVHDEVAANYRRESRARLAKWIRAKEQLNGLLTIPVAEQVDLDVDMVTRDYLSYLLSKLQIAADAVVPHKSEHLPDLISRAIERRRPCSERGEEIRDALLWHSVLDIASEANELVALVSKNTDQFSGDKQSLHPDLVGEAKARGARIQYYPSLEDFARRHATPIAFITKEWIEANVASEGILEGARGIVESYVEHWFDGQAEQGAQLTDYVNMLDGEVRVEDFFVYEMEDGSYRLEVTWLGVVEVEFEVEADEDSEEWDYDYEFNPVNGTYEYMPVMRRERARRARTRTREVELSVVIEAFVKDHNVERFRSIDGWVF